MPTSNLHANSLHLDDGQHLSDLSAPLDERRARANTTRDARARWSALRRSFQVSIRTRASERVFWNAKKRHSVFRRFPEPQALLAFLGDRSAPGDQARIYDEKNKLLATLVSITQTPDGNKERELAQSLLWIALWNGLDSVYRRLQRSRLVGEDDLPSAIAHTFQESVKRADLASITHVASSLVQNTERRFYEWHITPEQAVLRLSMDEVNWDGVADHDPPPVYDGVETLRVKLRPICGADTDLVISIAVGGERQAELGRRLGVTRSAVFNRFKRTIRILREHFDGE